MKPPSYAGAEVLSSRRVFRGRAIDLRVDRVRLPNGHESELEIIAHPGAAAVVPLTAQGDVVLVRQYRHAAGGWLLEVPAGKLDRGEAPESCGRRETAEEVGLRPRQLQALGSIMPTPGFADERIWLFLGTDLESVPEAREPDEVLEIVRLPFDDAVLMAIGGGPGDDQPPMTDAKSAIAILRAARCLGRL